ncbi:Holliday junction resolvase RecU [Lachnospira multipara]|uniref:Holliday junction resolvase RecU n=1 Tax=Lachnospira multipara TaxID=28051 RepID=UPI0004E26AB7|nr:Holliday junction resolvase RecU [Lachnospira multipara]
MGTWNSRGLRGEALEEFINLSIDKYKEKHLALIQKIPTPIKPIKLDPKTRQITLAFFDKKSTVDYIGVVQGIPVCFDAKECQTDTFPLANIHKHQMEFMRDFEEQDGISFIILYFSNRNEFYYVPYRDILFFWERMENGGRKSFTYDEIDKTYKIGHANNIIVHFLEPLNIDLASRD